MGLNVFSKKNLGGLKTASEKTHIQQREREEGTICISVRPKEDGIILIDREGCHSPEYGETD